MIGIPQKRNRVYVFTCAAAKEKLWQLWMLFIAKQGECKLHYVLVTKIRKESACDTTQTGSFLSGSALGLLRSAGHIKPEQIIRAAAEQRGHFQQLV